MLERLDGTFPLVAFPEKLQDNIRAARDTLNFPEPYTASVMLLAVAVAIGNTRVLKVKEGWMVKPILFLALVGEAGANKSHPISFVLKPLERINNAHIDAYNKALADYRKVKDANPSDKPQPRQVLVSDITTESLVQLHRSNPLRLCLRCDELAGWISNFNRYRKGGDEQLWLSIYSGQPLCVNRKTMDDILSVPDPFICVVGSIQPDILTATFSGERRSNGFLPRILQARQRDSWYEVSSAQSQRLDGFLSREITADPDSESPIKKEVLNLGFSDSYLSAYYPRVFQDEIHLRKTVPWLTQFPIGRLVEVTKPNKPEPIDSEFRTIRGVPVNTGFLTCADSPEPYRKKVDWTCLDDKERKSIIAKVFELLRNLSREIADRLQQMLRSGRVDVKEAIRELHTDGRSATKTDSIRGMAEVYQSHRELSL